MKPGSLLLILWTWKGHEQPYNYKLDYLDEMDWLFKKHKLPNLQEKQTIWTALYLLQKLIINLSPPTSQRSVPGWDGSAGESNNNLLKE